MRLLLLLLCAPALYLLSSTPTQPTPGGLVSLHGTTATSPPDVFRRTVAADLDGDGWQDLALVRGTDVEVLMAPGAFHAWSPDVAGATDIAGLPGSGGKDELALVGANGAQRLAFDWVQQGQTLVESWSVTTIEGSNWVGATHVAVSEVPGDSGPRIFGVMSDGSTVRTLVDSGSGYVDSLLFDVGKTIDELALVEWDGSSPPEVAVTTPYDPSLAGVQKRTSLLVYQRDGQTGVWDTVYENKVSGFDTVAMAAGRQASRPEEWIAWISSWNTDPDNEAMIVVDFAGASSPQWLPGDPLVAGLTAGDWDGDGNDDLVFGVQEDHSLVSLHNLGTSGPVFGTSVSSPAPPAVAAMIVLPLGPSGPAGDNEALATVADFDNDGVNDLAYPVQSTGDVLVDRNGPPGPDPGPRTVPQADFWIDCEELLFDLDDNQVWPAAIEQGENIDVRVEIALFVKPDGSSTNPDSIAVNMVASPTGEDLSLSFEVTLPTDDIYFWIVQFIDYDTQTQQIFRNHASQVYGMQLEAYYQGGTQPPNYTYLAERANGPFFAVNKDCNDTGIAVGNGVPVPNVPSIPNGESPRINWL